MCNKKEVTSIEERKLNHINACLTDTSDSLSSNGLEEYKFMHTCLPEISKDLIDMSRYLLRKKIDYPIMIAPMTGGCNLSKKINENLAQAAHELNIPMGLGSQRIMYENPHTFDTFKVRHIAPDILLFANLGAVQLNDGYDTEKCAHLVNSVEADALVLHLNPLQEAIQPGGNTDYQGITRKIETLVDELHVPVIVKETGCGISYDVAKKLREIGVNIVDVSGSGGTSWAGVECCDNKIGVRFRDWGISTAESIRLVNRVNDMKIIAGGGIRNGLEAAKAIALGADIVSVAKPLLKPALASAQEVIKTINNYIEELKIAMFCTGCKNVNELKNGNKLMRIC